MSKSEPAIDPRGLIREAYAMDIGPPECRAIFLDWAIGLQGPAGPLEVAALLDAYGARHPDHPMTAVLRAGLEPGAPGPPRRAGGPRGRDRNRAD